MLETLERSSNSILSKSTVIAERLSALLTPENQQIMLGAFAKTGQATAQWELLAKQLSPAIQQLPALTAQTGATLTSIQQLAEDARKMSQQLTLLTQQLQSPAAPFNRALSGVEHISDQMELETLPQINALTNDASNSVRAFNHTLNDLQEQPQSLLFGKPAPAPGPGESGFVAPTK